MSSSWPTLSRQDWPHDPQDLNTYYGDPRGASGANEEWKTENLVPFSFPWAEAGGVKTLLIHKRCLASLTRILQAIWDYAGHDQAKINAAHLNETGGTFNYRANKNDASKLSNHSYGIAIDLAPDENPNRAAWVEDGTHLPRWVIEAFKTEGWRWGGDYDVTKDAMHFEAVWDKHHDQGQVPITAVSVPPAPPVIPPVPPIVPHTSSVGGLGAAIAQVEQELQRFTEIEGFLVELDAHLAAGTALRVRLAAFLQTPSVPPPVAPLPPVPTVPAPPPTLPVPPPTPSQRMIGITATVEGGPGDPEKNPYTGSMVDPNVPGAALPFRFPKPVWVRVFNHEDNSRSIDCLIDDVGPWNIRDPYWVTGARPQSETGIDMSGRKTNHAGIDLTPAAARAIGIDGKGLVDFEFIPNKGT